MSAQKSSTLSLMGVYLGVSHLRCFSHPTCGDSVSEDTLIRVKGHLDPGWPISVDRVERKSDK
jgi:hypothetical protein